MPVNLVVDQVMDKRGFLWMHQGNQVTRFDGVSFKSYSAAKGTPGAIGGYSGICADSMGRIWLMGYDSLLMYNEKTDRFETLDDTGNKRPDMGFVQHLFHDGRHTLWLGGETGLYSLHTHSMSWGSTSFKFIPFLLIMTAACGWLPWAIKLYGTTRRQIPFIPGRYPFRFMKYLFPAIKKYGY